MNRRQFLAAATPVVIAGCQSDTDDPVRVPYVYVENFRPAEVSIVANLRADGRVVLSDQTTLASAEYSGYSGDHVERVPGEVWRLNELLERPVTVAYRIDGGDWEERTLKVGQADCVRPEIEAWKNGQSAVAHGYTCSTPATASDSTPATASDFE